MTRLVTIIRQIICRHHNADGTEAIADDDRGQLIDMGRRKSYGCTRCGGVIIL